jgi:acetyl coenzyme A synthetase (ADP forming)-like protein
MPESKLRFFFEPRTVAVIGAGRRRGGVGAEIFHSLAAGGFRGRAVPVNPNARDVDGVGAFATVSDVPGSVDLAVIAVPAACVDAAVDDCLVKGVPAIVVITAGFGEMDAAGRAREAALRDRVRAAGARMIGPNCMGVANMDPDVRLNATFSPAFPPPGAVALSSQSGALGLAILDYAKRLNLGMSNFVSIGNKADVSTNDLIEFWADDPRTSVILMYVESFGNPRRFSRMARRVARIKPIVAVKAGRTTSGARAASSHTGALASSDTLVDALFHQCGVIRTDTLEELFDVGLLLANQPVPAGPRVGILTNAGGPGILAADACEARGLLLPPLSAETVAALRAFLPASAGLANPVDMLATASAEDYRRAIPIILADPAIDSLLTIFIPPLVTDAADVASAIGAAGRRAAKPMLVTFLGAEGMTDALAPVPSYRFPESAAHALARAANFADWLATPAGDIPVLDGINNAAARAVIASASVSPAGWLSPCDAGALLEACAIPQARVTCVTSEDAAVAVATRVGYPVVLKAAGAAILHKTEAHAVRTDLRDAAAVRTAYREFASRMGKDVEQILVQPRVPDGVEFLVGVTFDPTFGHVLVCGLGGTLVEVLRDTSCRLHPLTDRDAADMIDGLRGAVLLRGFRGTPARKESALRDVLLRVSALVELCPEIVELDINPVIVTTTAATAVDVRIRIQR